MFDSYYIAQAMSVAAPANEMTTMEYVLNNQMLDFCLCLMWLFHQILKISQENA
jgi:hypothetical protein